MATIIGNVIQLHAEQPDPLAGLWADYIAAKRPEGLSDRTLGSRDGRVRGTYNEAAERLVRYAVAQEWPSAAPEDINRQQMTEFLAHLDAVGAAKAEAAGITYTRGTYATTFRSLTSFYKWAALAEDVPNPMPPKLGKVPVKQTIMPSDADLAKLLATCAKDGQSAYEKFTNRRDRVILALLMDSGLRRSELASLKVTDVNPDTGIIGPFVGKGGDERSAFFGDRTEDAIRAYLRARKLHNGAKLPNFLIGNRGGMTATGIVYVLTTRCEEAGIEHLNPHVLRHVWTDKGLEAGVSETDMMTAGGWKTATMLRTRYGATRKNQRAKAAHRANSFLDRL